MFKLGYIFSYKYDALRNRCRLKTSTEKIDIVIETNLAYPLLSKQYMVKTEQDEW